MMARFPTTWQGYFTQPATSAPAAGQRPVPPPRVAPPSLAAGLPGGKPPHEGRAGTEAGGTSGDVAPPPLPPRPPVDGRPLPPPEPPRRPLEYAWLTWQMPAAWRADVIFNLRQTFDWRAQYCKPLDAPRTAPEYTRFGLLGEQLVPKGGLTVRRALRAELRESIRMLEGEQPRLERNWLLAMHSTRLGQLCAELEQRGLDVLEEIRCALMVLWT